MAAETSFIVPMGPIHLDTVAKMHLAHLPRAFFSRLGYDFVYRIYEAISTSPWGVALVAEEDGVVEGYIAAALDSERLSGWLWTHRISALLGPLCGFGLTRPLTLIRECRDIVGYGSRTRIAGVEAELLYIGVRPGTRRRGMGVSLVRAACRAIEESGRSQVKVSTAEDNAGANGLLESMTFSLVRKFPFQGMTNHLYLGHIPAILEGGTA